MHVSGKLLDPDTRLSINGNTSITNYLHCPEPIDYIYAEVLPVIPRVKFRTGVEIFSDYGNTSAYIVQLNACPERTLDYSAEVLPYSHSLQQSSFRTGD